MRSRAWMPVFFAFLMVSCSHGPATKSDAIDSSANPQSAVPQDTGASKTVDQKTTSPLPASARFDDRGWKQISEEDGIKTFRLTPVEGENPYGDVVAFRGETTINAKLIKVATILNEPDLRKEWIDSFAEAYTVETKSKFSRIEYSRTSVPWPFQDRDFVFKVNVQLDRGGATAPFMKITMKSVEDPRVPEKDGIVRGEILLSHYFMEETSDRESTRVVVEIAANPKGAIPLWLVNSVQKRWPLNTLRNLRRLSMLASIPVSKEIEDYFAQKVAVSPTKERKNK